MSKSRTKQLKRFFSKPLGMGVLLILIAGLVMLALELSNTTHLFHKESSKVIVTAGTPVAAPTSTPSSTAPKTPASNSSSAAVSRNSGGATDTGGSVNTSTPSNQWTVSASGVITVKQPTANAKLKDGDPISGSAKVDTVSYRLSDNKVGVIAQGTLNVVDGNFSGTLHFQPQGTGGRLDIFSTDSQGVEYNEVQINVSF